MIKTIDQAFANSPYETATTTEKAFNQAFYNQLGNIALIIRLVIGAAFITILMIVGNTMVVAVRERTREIGVLKTLGFSRGRVLRLVLGETLLPVLIGGLPGIALAALAILNMHQSLLNFVPGLTLDLWVVAEALILMISLGLAACARDTCISPQDRRRHWSMLDESRRSNRFADAVEKVAIFLVQAAFDDVCDRLVFNPSSTGPVCRQAAENGGQSQQDTSTSSGS